MSAQRILRGHETALQLRRMYPHLRCLHLSKDLVPQPMYVKLDRRKYKYSILEAPPGLARGAEGGTGRDIYYSIWQGNDRTFPRLEEGSHYGVKWAYMFNVPCVRRQVYRTPDRVLTLKSRTTLIRAAALLGPRIFERYAGYEIDGFHGPDWHLSQGYGCVWDVSHIKDWTLVAELVNDAWDVL